MVLTKKHMVEDYPRLERKAGLLDLFMHDTMTGRKYDAEVTIGEYRAILYRATGAHGGYVAWNIIGNTYVEYLDEAIERVPRDEAYPERRTIVAKLQGVRYRLLNPVARCA